MKCELEMDRKTLVEGLRNGPLRVTMNDGAKFEIPSLEFCAVSDIAAYVLLRDPEDGKLRGRHLALVCMSQIEN